MNRTLLTLAALLGLLVSCGSPVKDDHSLTLEEYSKLGVPGLNRPWSIVDYSNTFSYLNQLKIRDPLRLPRKFSKKSGELFDHMTSLDNLSFLDNDSLFLWERAYMIRDFTGIHDEFYDLYTRFLETGDYYSTELIYIFIFSMTMEQEMLYLAYKINESDNMDDIGMQSGFGAIQQQYVGLLTMLIGEHQRGSFYKKEDLEVFSDSIAVAVKRNMEWFNPDQASQVGQTLQEVLDNLDSPAIREEYQELIDGLMEE